MRKLPIVAVMSLAAAGLVMGGCGRQESAPEPVRPDSTEQSPDAEALRPDATLRDGSAQADAFLPDASLPVDASDLPDASAQADAAAPLDASLQADGAEQADAAASPDASAPQPKRRLATYKPFGDSPVANLFLAPDMAPGAWYLNPQADVYPRVEPLTPSGQPILQVEAQSAGATRLMAEARGGPGPFDVSIALGRAVGAGVATDDFQVVVLGFAPGSNATDSAFPLTPEADEQALGGIAWRRYSGRIESELVGWGMLAVTNPRGDQFFAAAPRMVQAEPSANVRSFRSVASRAPLDAERSLALFVREERKRRTPPILRPPAVDAAMRHRLGEALKR